MSPRNLTAVTTSLQLLKSANRPLSGNDLKTGKSVCCVWTDPWGESHGDSNEPFKNCIFVCMSHGCHGYILHGLSEWDVLGARPLRWESGRSWGTGCWIQTLHSPGKIWDSEFLPKCMFLCQGGAYGDRVSQPFLLFDVGFCFVLFFSHLPSVWESLS